MTSDLIVFDMGVLDNSAAKSFENMRNSILTHKPKNVLFIGKWELIYPFFNCYLEIKDNVRDDFDMIHEFGDFLEEQGTQFHLILSTFDDSIFDRFRTKPVKNFNLHFWSAWCLFGLVEYMQEKNVNLFEKNIETDFDKLFVCFINKGKYHRQVLIDLICKNQLFDNSIVTWHKKYQKFIDNRNHKFECWDEVELTYDDYSNEPFKETSLNTKCLINLVSETHREGLFFSEKTWKPLITGHPFISLGAKNQNKVMELLGFKLYDELFDYTFDTLETVEERAEGLIKNLVKLNGKDLKELYDSIKEKSQFNKNRAKQILDESLYIPDIIIDLFQKHNKRIEINELTYKNVMEFLYQFKKD